MVSWNVVGRFYAPNNLISCDIRHRTCANGIGVHKVLSKNTNTSSQKKLLSVQSARTEKTSNNPQTRDNGVVKKK